MIHCEEVENGKVNVSMRGDEREIVDEIVMILISFTRNMTEEQRKNALLSLVMTTVTVIEQEEYKVSNAVESKVDMTALRNVIEKMKDNDDDNV